MNFWIRLISSIVLTVLALFTVSIGREVLLVTLLVISVVGFMELTRAFQSETEHKKMNGLQVVGILGTICYYFAVGFIDNFLFAMCTIFLTLIALMFVYVFTFPKFTAKRITETFFSFMYAPVMIAFIYLTRNLDQGIYIVWMIFISSWISDTCAYCIGMLFGKHKLCPNLSPKKSVEGAIGGVLGATLVGGLLGYFVVSKQLAIPNGAWIFAVLGGIGSMISQIGDLAASGIKRNVEIKDYGKCIPGHGGIMDRFDSVIFVAPVIYFLAILMINV